jgi:hypothetical protein
VAKLPDLAKFTRVPITTERKILEHKMIITGNALRKNVLHLTNTNRGVANFTLFIWPMY